MIRALILSGGVSHDFGSSSTALRNLLAGAGIDAQVEEDLDAGLDRFGDADVIILNTLRWTMRNGARYESMRDRWGYDVGPRMRNAFADHLAQGRGVVGLHAASICFDDWPVWGELLGARWHWDVSRHDAPGPADVVFSGYHPIVDGLADFAVIDEIYTKLDIVTDAPVLARATPQGQDQSWPVLWARSFGGGRVVYDALGHDDRSILNPVHSRLILRSVAWAAGKTEEEMPRA